MATTVDYYLSLNSPWTYLGHDRFMAIAAKAGATVRLWPVDFSVIFPETGGLPVGKRSPQRQAYRLQELERWRDFLGVPLNLHPAHDDGLDAARLAGAYMRAVWAEERDIGDETTALAIAKDQGIDGASLRSRVDACLEQRDRDSRDAIGKGVFGAPSYVIGDRIYWGQDRLDFVERALA